VLGAARGRGGRRGDRHLVVVPSAAPPRVGSFTFARRAYEAALAAPVRLGADPLA
jgi:hypothetical protein